jgi:hypothetical protein
MTSKVSQHRIAMRDLSLAKRCAEDRRRSRERSGALAIALREIALRELALRELALRELALRTETLETERVVPVCADFSPMAKPRFSGTAGFAGPTNRLRRVRGSGRHLFVLHRHRPPPP